MQEPAGRRRGARTAVAWLAAVLALALAMPFSGTAAADELEERKAALDAAQQQVQSEYEYLDADIARTVAELALLRDQLPARQEALTAAEGRVDTAAAKVADLRDRLSLAQETRTSLTQQIERDAQAMTEAERKVGQIASQAYKNGGMPSSLSLMLGADGAENLSGSMGLAEHALRNQNAALARLSEQNATNLNSEARLAAVEEEITDLENQASAALAAEEEARNEAAAEKEKLDGLIGETETLNNQLEEQKPAIQARLSNIQAQQQQVTNDIAERQRRQLEEARRAAEEAARRAAEEAARNGQGGVAPQAPVAPSAPSSFGLRHPVSAPVSSGFGWRATPPGTIDFLGNGGYLHSGLDYAATCGTPVYAPAAGEVWRADQGQGEMIGSGNRVVLNHGVMGTNVLATNYFHLSSFVVSVGQYVQSGQLIGYVGNTGNSAGCHLHFETMLNGNLVDPMGLL